MILYTKNKNRLGGDVIQLIPCIFPDGKLDFRTLSLRHAAGRSSGSRPLGIPALWIRDIRFSNLHRDGTRIYFLSQHVEYGLVFFLSGVPHLQFLTLTSSILLDVPAVPCSAFGGTIHRIHHGNLRLFPEIATVRPSSKKNTRPYLQISIFFTMPAKSGKMLSRLNSGAAGPRF